MAFPPPWYLQGGGQPMYGYGCGYGYNPLFPVPVVPGQPNGEPPGVHLPAVTGVTKYVYRSMNGSLGPPNNGVPPGVSQPPQPPPPPYTFPPGPPFCPGSFPAAPPQPPPPENVPGYLGSAGACGASRVESNPQSGRGDFVVHYITMDTNELLKRHVLPSGTLRIPGRQARMETTRLSGTLPVRVLIHKIGCAKRARYHDSAYPDRGIGIQELLEVDEDTYELGKKVMLDQDQANCSIKDTFADSGKEIIVLRHPVCRCSY